jgi:hypothetical protein
MQEYFCRDLKGLAYEDGSARTTANDGMAGGLGFEPRLTESESLVHC